MNIKELKDIIQASLPEKSFASDDITHAITRLKQDYQDRSIEICEAASGYRFQVREHYTHWLQKLLPEKQERYSQAVLETLTLIAYRQPITRGEIEQIRGVSVSTQTIRTLLEREWIRVLGHKQVPGKPALYGTTAKFLNDFNLSHLSQLPKLPDMDPTQTITFEQGELGF